MRERSEKQGEHCRLTGYYILYADNYINTAISYSLLLMLPPNILITNHCNQNCPFCFAREEMGSLNGRKDMAMEDYRSVIGKIKRSSRSRSVRLLGGEPTIHTKFKDIISYSLANFDTVQLFTNGVFSEDTASFLSGYGARVRYVFNLMTPGFLFRKKTRDLVMARICGLPRGVHIGLSLTVDPFTDVQAYLKLIPDRLLERVSMVRLGLSNQLKGEKNCYTVRDFPRVGEVFTALKKRVQAINSAISFVYGCGLTRCMFTANQYADLTQGDQNTIRFGCFGKKSSMDITTDLRSLHCFPLSAEKTITLKNKTLAKVNATLVMRRYVYWQKTQLSMCGNCPFFGVGDDKCPGPCIAFRFNQS